MDVHTSIDHIIIRQWIEKNGGKPAIVRASPGLLRVDFGEADDGLEVIDWDNFFELFEKGGWAFVYGNGDGKEKFARFVTGKR